MTPEIWISPHFSGSAKFLALKELSCFKVHSPSAHEWSSGSKKVLGVLIRSSDQVNQSFIKRFPKLEAVCSATSGFDHFDLSFFKDTDLQGAYCPEANTQSAAELTVFHILNLLRNQPLGTPEQKWRLKLGQELAQKKILIVGFGRIGNRVANLLKSFESKVQAYDPYLFDFSLHEGLEWADVVSLHAPLTKKTHHIISKTELNLMHPSSYLVNCARGELVNTSALLKALDTNQIAGAALDVFEEEPLFIKHPLRSHPKLQWSPHIGAYTFEAQHRSVLEASSQMKNWFLNKTPLPHIVPPQVPWAKDL